MNCSTNYTCRFLSHPPVFSPLLSPPVLFYSLKFYTLLSSLLSPPFLSPISSSLLLSRLLLSPPVLSLLLFFVLCSLYHTVVTKKELSQKAKLSFYQSIFVSTLMS